MDTNSSSTVSIYINTILLDTYLQYWIYNIIVSGTFVCVCVCVCVCVFLSAYHITLNKYMEITIFEVVIIYSACPNISINSSFHLFFLRFLTYMGIYFVNYVLFFLFLILLRFIFKQWEYSKIL